METLIAGTKVNTSLITSKLGAWNGEECPVWAGKITVTLDDGVVVTANLKGDGNEVELYDIEGEDEHACEAVELYRDVYEAALALYLGRA